MLKRWCSFTAGFWSIMTLCAGCSSALSSQSQFILKNGDQYQLMLVHANVLDPTPQPGMFHGCIVDKTLMLTDSKSRQKLVDVLWWDIWSSSVASLCIFDPHYAVRITRGTKTLDFVICFHCMQCDIFEGNGASSSHGIDQDGKTVFEELIPDDPAK